MLGSACEEAVGVVAFGGTQCDMVVRYQGVLLVNPGGQNLPAARMAPNELGTVAILEVRDRVITVEMVRLKGG